MKDELSFIPILLLEPLFSFNNSPLSSFSRRTILFTFYLSRCCDFFLYPPDDLILLFHFIFDVFLSCFSLVLFYVFHFIVINKIFTFLIVFFLRRLTSIVVPIIGILSFLFEKSLQLFHAHKTNFFILIPLFLLLFLLFFRLLCFLL